ncbi:F-box family protein [Klebsormidium nitens]|uniref:F-box family protein n=1 Tax=Klebsormidium nitens TaxID=105231 RepID=A0A1Y1IFW4_KLENI|nr:F-box family protein [Klebsormidium nitens]|eukprot:GAQ87627.1 F-box family protein [Klebsormidium nitens]
MQRTAQLRNPCSFFSSSGDVEAEYGVSEARSALPYLAPDILQRVFAKVGPHPKDLVPLGAVCKEWRQILDDVTWKELCMTHAAGLVEELGYYDPGAGDPPGGWRGLFKLLVYCPGILFPTFEPVLESDALWGRYEWTECRGHVETELPRGFHRVSREEARQTLSLDARFWGDEIFVARRSYCERYHRAALRREGTHEYVSRPPVLPFRGMLRNFERSEIAQATGAAACLNRKEKLGEENLDWGGGYELFEVKDEAPDFAQDTSLNSGKGENEVSSKETTTPTSEYEGVGYGNFSELDEDFAAACPYCGAQTFPLPDSSFIGPYTAESYDHLLADVRADNPDETNFANGRYMLMTGFVCLSGHLVLGMAGFPCITPVSPDLDRSDWDCFRCLPAKLRLDPAEAVAFAIRFMLGERSFDPATERPLVRALTLDQLIQIERRLAELKSVWPVTVIASPLIGDVKYYKAFKDYSRSFKVGRPEVSVVKMLDADEPTAFLETVRAFVVAESGPSLAEWERLILDALEAHERERSIRFAQLDREREIHLVLCGAGFNGPPFPDQQSIDKFVQDPEATSITEILAEQTRVLEQSK